MFTIRKAYNEGGDSPFMVRMLLSYTEWRELFVPELVYREMAASGPTQRAVDLAIERERSGLDALQTPMFGGLYQARLAQRELDSTLAKHVAGVASGDLVGWQEHAMTIKDSIDHRLRELTEGYLNSVCRALKTGLQTFLQHRAFGIDIGPLFQKRPTFDAWRAARGAAPQLASLSAYLEAARNDWSEVLLLRRNSLEHDGWVLPSVEYRPVVPGTSAIAIEPVVDGKPLREFVSWTLSGALALSEDLVAYAFQAALRPEIILTEAPQAQGAPGLPRRFRSWPANPPAPLQAPPEWQMAYHGGAPEMRIAA